MVFVPTGQPWQKGRQAVTAAEDRYLMTVIATASNPRFAVSRVDIDRPGPTYTVDTLRDLRALYGPEAELFFITGADAVAKMLSWKDAERMFELARFVGRDPARLRAVHRAPAGRYGGPGRGAGDGDLVDRLPRAGDDREAGLVPGAGRCGAIHRQTRALLWVVCPLKSLLGLK